MIAGQNEGFVRFELRETYRSLRSPQVPSALAQIGRHLQILAEGIQHFNAGLCRHLLGDLDRPDLPAPVHAKAAFILFEELTIIVF